ncbi:uncharacterized protein LOC123543729 [Mercenaria mercenaria]|uniref:uncharacterized protein LOC123543729 n=1 Tax=Mercenaria mercenaria TaxID=6596 RepID=UPI00234E8822|nr:uncharacterized protein LOC123543729 [Mercenaria mercenaria]XP_053386696.1 uncharacterized protein LOC123543729 [Mercenaria mercenaria]XP_053386697.1 uncharacterized protein LOC123543729 [Mercenaria mercenaria]XP_053386698.1 uncharacterized protein LOC123543729 [Mercenaria mercenaria]
MEYVIRTALQAVVIFSCNGILLFPLASQTRPAHCTQTTRSGFNFRPKNILPSYVNAPESMEPPINSTETDMNLELCPDNVTLKIGWTMNKHPGTEMNLCYKIKSGQLLETSCVNLDVQYSEHPIIMTCWFPMTYISYKPMITALAISDVADGGSYFYRELNTSELDPRHSCKDMCEVSEMNINPLIFCNDTASIVFDEKINVKSLSFDATESTSCDNSSVVINAQTRNKLDYRLNCAYVGIGNVKVLYSINGKFCLKYQSVRVICDSRLKRKEAPTKLHVDDFQTFVIFGVVCMIVISVIFVIINFVAQMLRHLLKVRRRNNERDIDVLDEEGMPLHDNNIRPIENIPSPTVTVPITPVDVVIKREYRKRVDSMSSSDGQSTVTTSSFRGQTVRQLHRSMTVALLENTESFYRKKILFLPTPFDTFSRDATNLLKAVFTLELSIPTECCFDREVFQRYMTGNRYNWIETILGDYDRIVVFLCFTTIRGQICKSIIEDVLDHLSVSKIKPYCTVCFLHITDSSENLEKNHHGESFHLSDKISYKNFMGEVLKYCDRNPDAEPDLLYRLTNCEASRHFVRFIGME